jgi:hypothetical protein
MQNALILLATAAAAGLVFHPRVSQARLWRATMTPLASIIGSGFLVLGPILDASYGLYAPVVMALLCIGAYLFGSAVRYNIADIERDSKARSALERKLEDLASLSLAFAYIISVAYYLNLFGAFGLSLTPLNSPVDKKILTSFMLLLVLAVGWTRGFSALEMMEQISVGIKLAVIAGLLFGLSWYFVGLAEVGALVFNPPTTTGWPAITLGFGLIVTVQGFEASRYLGADYDAATRIRSMRAAQLLSAVIYMTYIGLVAYVFKAGAVKLEETAIVGMMSVVAPILPGLLVLGALSAQFSAAVADTSGSGGLMAESTRHRIKPQHGYAILVALGLVLTWTSNVFEIISYASRAFAFYYALQAALAALAAGRARHTVLSLAFAALAVLGVLITVFGTPVE